MMRFSCVRKLLLVFISVVIQIIAFEQSRAESAPLTAQQLAAQLARAQRRLDESPVGSPERADAASEVMRLKQELKQADASAVPPQLGQTVQPPATQSAMDSDQREALKKQLEAGIARIKEKLDSAKEQVQGLKVANEPDPHSHTVWTGGKNLAAEGLAEWKRDAAALEDAKARYERELENLKAGKPAQVPCKIVNAKNIHDLLAAGRDWKASDGELDYDFVIDFLPAGSDDDAKRMCAAGQFAYLWPTNATGPDLLQPEGGAFRDFRPINTPPIDWPTIRGAEVANLPSIIEIHTTAYERSCYFAPTRPGGTAFISNMPKDNSPLDPKWRDWVLAHDSGAAGGGERVIVVCWVSESARRGLVASTRPADKNDKRTNIDPISQAKYLKLEEQVRGSSDIDGRAALAELRASAAVNDPQAVASLIKLLRLSADGHTSHNAEIIIALDQSTDPRVVPALLAELSKANALFKTEKASQLATSNGHRFSSPSSASPTDDAALTAATNALGKRSEASAITPLLSIAKEIPSNNPPGLRCAVFDALGNLRNPDATKIIIAEMEAKGLPDQGGQGLFLENEERSHAVHALAALGGAIAMNELVRETITPSTASERRAQVTAAAELEKWPGDLPLGSLMAALRQNSQWPQRQRSKLVSAICRILTAKTGNQDNGDDVDKWQHWWQTRPKATAQPSSRT